MGGLEEDATVDEDAGVVDVVAGAAWPDRMCNMCNKDKICLAPGYTTKLQKLLNDIEMASQIKPVLTFYRFNQLEMGTNGRTFRRFVSSGYDTALY